MYPLTINRGAFFFSLSFSFFLSFFLSILLWKIVFFRPSVTAFCEPGMLPKSNAFLSYDVPTLTRHTKTFVPKSLFVLLFLSFLLFFSSLLDHVPYLRRVEEARVIGGGVIIGRVKVSEFFLCFWLEVHCAISQKFLVQPDRIFIRKRLMNCFAYVCKFLSWKVGEGEKGIFLASFLFPIYIFAFSAFRIVSPSRDWYSVGIV